MSADFFCWMCKAVFTGETFLKHRCGRITCAGCNVNMPVSLFQEHPCISELFRPTTGNASSVSTDDPPAHPSMWRRRAVTPLPRGAARFDQGDAS